MRNMALDAEIKFRCESDLVARFERIATLERRNTSDLARIVFEDYVAAQERALKLVLRDDPRHTPKKPSSKPPSDTAKLTDAAEKKDRRGRKS